MVTTLTSVKVLSVNVPAILVTGKDANGNEFGYRKRGDEWVDYYNESITTAERIRRDVFPNVQYVRYPISGMLEYKMSRAEWIENGCPLDLPKSVVETMIDTQPHPVDEAQTIEREIDKTLSRHNAELRWGNVVFNLEAMGENARQRSAELKKAIDQRLADAQERRRQEARKAAR